MKVDCVAAILIALFCRSEKSIHTSFADGSALIFLEAAVFNASCVSHLLACFIYFLIVKGRREFYFIITSNVICVVIVIRLSFIALECFQLFQLSYCSVFWVRILYLLCFVSFSIEQNINWRERVCIHLQAGKKRTYHLQSVPQYTASNWAKLFVRWVCVCVFECMCLSLSCARWKDIRAMCNVVVLI